MASDTWSCPRCGQIYPLAEPACGICHVTRINRHVTGRIDAPPRAEKPPPEPVEIQFPFSLKGARFNVPTPTGPVWTSGAILVIDGGLFLVSEQDALDPAALAASPPEEACALGSLSLYFPHAEIGRIVHEKLAGYFIETKARQKIPLRLEAAGWGELDIVCDQLRIPRR